jgi:DNA-binding MarR family transcriptional regulator
VVVPLAARCVAAAIGALLVLTIWGSVIGTLIVPRPVASWVTRLADRVVVAIYDALIRPVRDYERRDRILATQAAAILITQLVGWLGSFLAGFTLVLWPLDGRSISQVFTDAGSSIFTLGFAEPQDAGPAALVFFAAATGMVVVALQIGYLPTLYAAFNRRETQVALLNARSGFPAWGPELLARTQYALGTDTSTINTLPDLYLGWERWSADVAESHTTYLPLVRFRSPLPFSSWVTSLLAVLDSAALLLCLSPEQAPVVPARLCLRGGFGCLGRIARAMGFDVPEEADPDGGITLTYEEFLDAVSRLHEVGFVITRDPAEAWPEFVGWRVNYERAAYLIAEAIDAVPALWSGPRRHGESPVPPKRPPTGRQRPRQERPKPRAAQLPDPSLTSGYAGGMTGTWLSEDEQRAWRTYLRLGSLLPAALNRQLTRDCGLTLPEYEVLVQLSEAPEQRLRPFQICDALNWEQSRLSHQLTRMERRGLVTRRECPVDGRGAFVALTTCGAQAIREAAPQHAATVRRLIFDRLSDAQRMAFEEACSIIIDALTEEP